MTMSILMDMYYIMMDIFYGNNGWQYEFVNLVPGSPIPALHYHHDLQHSAEPTHSFSS